MKGRCAAERVAATSRRSAEVPSIASQQCRVPAEGHAGWAENDLGLRALPSLTGSVRKTAGT